MQFYFKLQQDLLLEILIRRFERFEDSLSNFRNQDNLFELIKFQEWKLKDVEKYYIEPRNFEKVHPGKLEILRFWDFTTSEFLLNLPFEKFERFEVSLSSCRDKENPCEREGERKSTRNIWSFDFHWFSCNFICIVSYERNKIKLIGFCKFIRIK